MSVPPLRIPPTPSIAAEISLAVARFGVPLKHRCSIKCEIPACVSASYLEPTPIKKHIDTERGWVKVTGKGAKERMVRIGATAQKALWRYLVYRPNNGRTELWLTEEGAPLQSDGIQMMIRRIKQRAGVTSKGNCHRFRHTFALNFLRADRNPFNLQYLLGHSDLRMVRHYTATLGMEDALKAHERASPADLLGFK